MNNHTFSDEQLDQLMAAARQAPLPDNSALEYAFETRVMSRIREKQRLALSAWTFERVAFRLSPFFALVALAIFTLFPEQPVDTATDNGDGHSLITSVNVFGSAEADPSWEDVN